MTFVQTVAQTAYTQNFVDFIVNSLVYLFSIVRMEVRKREQKV